MRLGKKEWIGIIFGLIIIAGALIFLLNDKIFWFVIGIGIIIIVLPFIVGASLESSKEKEDNEMFLEFTRDLVESVKSGTPISKSIINVKSKSYGSLTPYVQKLANQISLGIPVKNALEVFAHDVDSSMISRSINLMKQAETAGGDIDKILESVSSSVAETEKLQKERKAGIYNLVVQGYIIFFVFIAIMLVIEFKILTMTMDLGVGAGDLGIGTWGGFGGGSNINPEELSTPFLYLLLTQGLFAGLTIGKLSEGRIKSGLKHSFILMALTFLISFGARAFFG